MGITKVVHLRKDDYTVYIGRPSPWGNPFTHLNHGLGKAMVSSHEESIEAYELWLRGKKYQDFLQKKRAWILKNLGVLDGETLGCFCKPKSCHGDILLKLYAEQMKK